MALVGAFDFVIVGAGITGCEAAWRTARAGLSTLLVTTSLDTIYVLAHEAAPLSPPPGSLLGELASGLRDEGGRIASWPLHRAAKYALEALPKAHLLQSTVSGLLVEEGRVAGVTTWEGVDRRARLTALTVGSFLRARLLIGSVEERQGRLSEMAYDDLADDLAARGFQFRPVRLELGASLGSLPYVVESVALASSDAAMAGFALPRLAGLYAAGVCAPGYEDGPPPSYEQAVELGMRLGDELIAAARSRLSRGG